MNRRRFLKRTSCAFAALVASGCRFRDDANDELPGLTQRYGGLVSDPEGFLSLPPGFRYEVLSRFDEPMDDGGTVPDKADGMGCFALGNGEIALVRNHELTPSDDAGGQILRGYGMRNGKFVPGGTTHIVLDEQTLAVKRQFRSLGGTIRNCSGGTTPWGSWLSCEEAPTGPGQRYGDGLQKNHGWVFEVPADARGLLAPEPLYDMGRFNHEAACVDPLTGIVYLTEDRDDSVLYRFVPRVPGDLTAGGQLQAMRVDRVEDTRNWSSPAMAVGTDYDVAWVDLVDVDSPDDDLRRRAFEQGATIIARGEGIHMGADELYVCSTSGGAEGLGQIFRLRPGRDAAPDRVALFFESESKAQFNYGDNLTVAPGGDLIVCEDQYTPIVDNHLRVISSSGRASTLAKLHVQTELAGACFSPDGKWLFVNAYSPTRTIAITGPWSHATVS